MPWFVPILVSAAAIFALGVLGFVRGIIHSGILSPGLTRIVVAALLVMALSRFFPVGAAQLYVGPAGGIVALWPLAWAIRKRAGARATVSREPSFR